MPQYGQKDCPHSGSFCGLVYPSNSSTTCTPSRCAKRLRTERVTFSCPFTTLLTYCGLTFSPCAISRYVRLRSLISSFSRSIDFMFWRFCPTFCCVAKNPRKKNDAGNSASFLHGKNIFPDLWKQKREDKISPLIFIKNIFSSAHFLPDEFCSVLMLHHTQEVNHSVCGCKDSHFPSHGKHENCIFCLILYVFN